MGFKKKSEIDQFIQNISRSVEVIIWKIFSDLSSDDHSDIKQEVNLKIWKAISSGKNIKNLRSYLWKVVYTTALDFINGRMRYVNVEKDREFYITDCLHESEEISIGSLLEKKQSIAVLMKAIETLTQNRRIVLKLSLKGMKIIEIAQFLGWSQSKVNHLYYRGLEDLKKRMKTE